MITRRQFILAAGSAALVPAPPAWAHHGWSSFDQDKPLYLSGTVRSVRWQNPHAEFVLTVPKDLALPADLSGRKLPAQSHTVDGAALLKRAALPAQAAGEWEIELAPLSRMSAWQVQELKPGDRVELIGYALEGKRVFRVEYLFANGKVAGLRSSPQ